VIKKLKENLHQIQLKKPLKIQKFQKMSRNNQLKRFQVSF
jgi:hypothetical protein